MASGIALLFILSLLSPKSHALPKPDCALQHSQAQFESCVLSEIKEVDLQGINPEYLLTIAILETGYGQGSIYQHTKNLFSIKADSGYLGKTYFSMGYYRVYLDDREAIKDVVRLLTTRSRYRKAYVYALMDDHKNFFRALQRAGYSEDNRYGKKLEEHFQAHKFREITTRISQHKSVVDSTNNRIAYQTSSK